MGIEDFKRWHWILIGLLLGLGLSYARTGVEPEPGRNNVTEFLRDVTLSDPKDGPLVRRVVVHPAQTDFRAQASLDSAARKEAVARAADDAAKRPPPEINESQLEEYRAKKREEAAAAGAAALELRDAAGKNGINLVTYERLCRDRAGSTKWRGEQFYAEIPFRGLARGANAANTSGTIVEYLEAMKKQNPSISYRYAWWNTKPAQYTIWTGGGVLAVGILWPNVLSALIGAGYGRSPEERSKKKRDSLFSYQSRPEPASTASAKRGVTLADQQKLRDMTDQLERNLASDAVRHGDHAPLPAGSGAVRKLEGGPLEMAAQTANPADDDEIEVKGEYYPVLIHHKKQHQSDDDHNQAAATTPPGENPKNS